MKKSSVWTQEDWQEESRRFPAPRLVACGTRHIAPDLGSFAFSFPHAGHELRTGHTHDAHVSSPFEALGQSWCLVMYPHCIDHDTGDKCVSLFLRRAPAAAAAAEEEEKHDKDDADKGSSAHAPAKNKRSIYFRMSSPRATKQKQQQQQQQPSHSMTASHPVRLEYGWSTFLSHEDVLASFLHGPDETFKVQLQMTYHVPAVRTDLLVERPLVQHYSQQSLVVACDQTASALSLVLATSTIVAIPVKYQQLWIKCPRSTIYSLVGVRQSFRAAWEQGMISQVDGRQQVLVRDTRQTLAAASKLPASVSSVLLLVSWFDASTQAWLRVGSGEFARTLSLESVLKLVLARLTYTTTSTTCVMRTMNAPDVVLSPNATLETLHVHHGQELMIHDATIAPLPLPSSSSSSPVEWARFGSIEADLTHYELCQDTFDEAENIRNDIEDASSCNEHLCLHHQHLLQHQQQTHSSDSHDVDEFRDRLQMARLRRRRERLLMQLDELETNLIHARLIASSNTAAAAAEHKSDSDDIGLTTATVLAKKRSKRQRQKQARQKPQSQPPPQQQNKHLQKKPLPTIKMEADTHEKKPDKDAASSSSSSSSDSVASDLDDESFLDRILPNALLLRTTPSKPLSSIAVVPVALAMDVSVPSLRPSPPPPPPPTIAGFMGSFDANVIEEIRKRALVGVSSDYEQTLKALEPGSPIFCFEPRARVLHGPFYTSGVAGNNLDARAFLTTGGRTTTRSRFPIQVRISTPVSTKILPEAQWQHLIRGSQRIRALRSFECTRLLKLKSVVSKSTPSSSSSSTHKTTLPSICVAAPVITQPTSIVNIDEPVPLDVSPVNTIEDVFADESDLLLACEELDRDKMVTLACDTEEGNDEVWTDCQITPMIPSPLVLVPVPFDVPASFLSWTIPTYANQARQELLTFLLHALENDARAAHRIWMSLPDSVLCPADVCAWQDLAPEDLLLLQRQQHGTNTTRSSPLTVNHSSSWSLFSQE
jgi:hypothetical protein